MDNFIHEEFNEEADFEINDNEIEGLFPVVLRYVKSLNYKKIFMFVLFGSIFLFSIYSIYMEKYYMIKSEEQEVLRLKDNIEKNEIEIGNLKKDIKDLNSDIGIEMYARNILKMTRTDEIIFVKNDININGIENISY